MRIAFIIFFLLFTFFGTAQKLVLKFSFQGIGDNREFHNGQSMSQTILGTIGSAQIGIKIDEHRLYAGISELYEFGSEISFHQPWLIMYYQFEDPKKQFQFGSFPRLGIIDFPLAMLADTLLYFRPNIEGMSGKITGDRGYQMAFVDWIGRQTKTIRETFMVGTSGEIRFNKAFFQNYVLMHHFAHTAERIEGQHIKDYFGFSLMGGVRMGSEKTLHAEVKAGLLSSLYRERSVTDGFRTGYSLIAEAIGWYKTFALKTILHSGDKQTFALGDPFFRFRDYVRTDAIWYFIQHKNIKGRFNWSFHWTNSGRPDHSQQLSLIYQL
jgi:hypothetical protein